MLGSKLIFFFFSREAYYLDILCFTLSVRVVYDNSEIRNKGKKSHGAFKSLA